MGEEVFIYTGSLNEIDKIETVIAGHLRNGWKIEGMTRWGMGLIIIFSKIIIEEER